MELRFVSPDLAELDRVGMEVLVAAVFSDERPARGVAGLFDWRSAGSLSRLMLDGYVTGELGEILMTPARPGLPFDKILLFGAGHSAEFDDTIFGALVERMLETMANLRARSVVVQLPGRHLDIIPAERAADILLQGSADKPEHDVWTLVEPAPAQKAITDHLLKKRRRRDG
jgi:Cytosol aminopeptidase family, N-terminal domain